MGLLLAAFWLLLAKFAVAQEASSYFISPPNKGQERFFVDDEILSIGTQLEVQWVTNMTQYSIYLWQQSLTISSAAESPSIYTKIIGGPEEGGFLWTVTSLNFDLTQSPVFFFSLGPQPEIANSITSHYFNLTAASAASSSVTAKTSSSTSTSSSAAAAITSSTTSVTSSSSSVATSAAPSPSSTSSSSATTRIGLGVGLGLGIPLILLLLYITIGKIRKSRRKVQLEKPVSEHQESPTEKSTVAPVELSVYNKTHATHAGDQGRYVFQPNFAELPVAHGDGQQLPRSQR